MGNYCVSQCDKVSEWNEIYFPCHITVERVRETFPLKNIKEQFPPQK